MHYNFFVVDKNNSAYHANQSNKSVTLVTLTYHIIQSYSLLDIVCYFSKEETQQTR